MTQPEGSRPPRSNASRGAPPRIEPIVSRGLRFEAPWTERGILIAKDAKSGAERWRLPIVDYVVDPGLETDVQQVYLAAMELAAGGHEILLTDEVGTRYRVAIDARSAQILTWPAELELVASSPTQDGWRYRVALTIRNVLTRPLALDGPSVAEDGTLSNNLFTVEVDGRKVAYRGPMVKRGPPAKFIELGSGGRYRTEVELGDHYPVPPGRHVVRVAYRSTNHFSPDGFELSSPTIEVTLEGEGFVRSEKPRPE